MLYLEMTEKIGIEIYYADDEENDFYSLVFYDVTPIVPNVGEFIGLWHHTHSRMYRFRVIRREVYYQDSNPPIDIGNWSVIELYVERPTKLEEQWPDE